MNTKKTSLLTCLMLLVTSPVFAANPLEYFENNRTPIWWVAAIATTTAAYVDYSVAESYSNYELSVKDWLKDLLLFNNKLSPDARAKSRRAREKAKGRKIVERTSLVSKVSPWIVRSMLLADLVFAGCEIAIHTDWHQKRDLQEALDSIKSNENGEKICPCCNTKKLTENTPMVHCRCKNNPKHVTCAGCAREIARNLTPGGERISEMRLDDGRKIDFVSVPLPGRLTPRMLYVKNIRGGGWACPHPDCTDRTPPKTFNIPTEKKITFSQPYPRGDKEKGLRLWRLEQAAQKEQRDATQAGNTLSGEPVNETENLINPNPTRQDPFAFLTEELIEELRRMPHN